MQAGDKLNFIRPFIQQQEIDLPNQAETEMGTSAYVRLCMRMLNKYSDQVRAEVIKSWDEELYIVQSKQKIVAADGSELRIDVNAISEDKDIARGIFELVIIEQDSDGIETFGYSYSFDASGGEAVHRTDLVEGSTTVYGDVFALLEASEELYRLENSEWDADKEVVEIATKKSEEREHAHQMEVDMRINHMHVGIQEIQNLSTLFDFAVPADRATR